MAPRWSNVELHASIRGAATGRDGGFERPLPAAAHLEQYLVDNNHVQLKGHVRETDHFEHFADSNHAGERVRGTKSRTSVMNFLNGVPVDWASQTQPVTALSSAEAEIYALLEAVKRARLLQWRAEELGIKTQRPMLIQMDNKAGISFQKATCNKTKLAGTFDLRDNRLRELKNTNEIATAHVPSSVNPADLGSKNHPPHKFQQLMRLIANKAVPV